jgi:hypothetical protein
VKLLPKVKVKFFPKVKEKEKAKIPDEGEVLLEVKEKCLRRRNVCRG